MGDFVPAVNDYGDPRYMPRSPPAGWPKGMNWMHFSDMFVLRAFLGTRLNLKNFTKIDAGYRDIKMDLVDSAIHNVNLNGMLSKIDWTNVSVQGIPVRIPRVRRVNLVGIHFQGAAKGKQHPTFMQ